MPITRRTVLRNLGTLTAASALPIIGCKTAPAPHADGSIRVIFAGPWMINGDKSGTLFATTDISSYHSCVCEKWINGSPAATGTFTPPTIAQADRWHGTFTPAQTSSSFKAVKDAFINNNAPYFGKHPVAPLPKDLHFTLPAPDAAYLGGRLMDGYISDEAGKLVPGKMPYVATILHYHQNAGQQPFSLSLADPAQHGNTTITANSGEDLIFHVVHDPADPQPEGAHIPNMFANILTRIGAPKWQLHLNDPSFVANQNPDGVTDKELELGEPTGTHLAMISAEVNSRGFYRPIFSALANCAGGGAGGDCCD